MKKLLLVFVLAAACFALLATPALASYPPTYQPLLNYAPGNAYVALRAELWGGNVWGEVDALGVMHTYIDVTPTPDGFEAWRPIPHGYHVFIMLGWTTPTREQIQNLPSTVLYDIKLYRSNHRLLWSSSTCASQWLWSAMYSWGPYPSTDKPDATYWQRDFYKDVGILPIGAYSGTTKEIVTHTFFDHSYNGDPATWTPHAEKPVKIPAGTNHFTFAFTVGP